MQDILQKEISVPQEYAWRELAAEAYRKGFRQGVKRAYALRRRQADPGWEIPVEFLDVASAENAWCDGQINGYRAGMKHVALMDEDMLDQAAGAMDCAEASDERLALLKRHLLDDPDAVGEAPRRDAVAAEDNGSALRMWLALVLALLGILFGLTISGCGSCCRVLPSISDEDRLPRTESVPILDASAPAEVLKPGSGVRDIMAVNDATFDERIAKSTGLVLADFSADWCGYCRKQAPEFAAYGAASDLPTVTVDFDNSPRTNDALNVVAIPCLILFRDGKEIARARGYHTKDEIAAFVKPFLSSASLR